MAVSPVLHGLRLATADLHRSVEIEAGVEPRLRHPLERPAMVARLLAFHLAVERVLAPWRAAFEQVGYTPDHRSMLIRKGLADLGGSSVDEADGGRAASFGEALGWAYVAEGSMLGGRVMRRDMIRDGIALVGLDFLDPYGENTGDRWRAFLHALDTACAMGLAQPTDIFRGGEEGFGLASRLLIARAPVEFA